MCEGGLRAGLTETKGLCGGLVESFKNAAADSVCKLVSKSTSPVFLAYCACQSDLYVSRLQIDLFNIEKKKKQYSGC